MDDKSKRRIRSIAKRLHWLLQIIIFIAIASKMVFLYAGTQIAKEELQSMVSSRPLSNAGLRVLNAVWWEEVPKVATLYAYPLPQDAKDYGVWADSIQRHLERPSAVFVTHDGKLDWLIEHDHLLPAKATAESLAVGLMPHLAYVKQVGEWKTTSVSRMLPDSSSFTVSCFEQQGRSERWGIVVSDIDSWRAFARALNEYKEGNKFDSRIGWVENDLNVGGTSPFKHNFRIFIHDSLAFESPEFDTTKYVHSVGYGAISEDYQLCDSEQQWRDRAAGKLKEDWGMGWGWFDWSGLIKAIFYSFVIALFYHWILKLTSAKTDILEGNTP